MPTIFKFKASCDRFYCDFVCWTPNRIHIEQILRDDKVFLEMKPKLEVFFVHVILPRVLRGQMEKENFIPATVARVRMEK